MPGGLIEDNGGTAEGGGRYCFLPDGGETLRPTAQTGVGSGFMTDTEGIRGKLHARVKSKSVRAI